MKVEGKVKEVIAEENPIIFPFIVEEVRDSSGKTINIWGRWIEFFDAILPLMNEEVFFPFFKGSNLALHHGVDLWVRGCKELASRVLLEGDTLPKFLITSDMEAFAKEILRKEGVKEAARGICRRIEEKLKKEEEVERFIEASPYGSTDWGGTRMVLLEDAYGDNIFWGGESRPCFAARAVNADDRMDKRVYKCIWLDTPPEGMPEYWCEDPDNYIDWGKCDDAIKTDEYYDEED